MPAETSLEGVTGAGAPSLLVVVSGPSGVGKSTICDELTRRDDNLVFSVSYTTRTPRSDEVDGRDYRFVDASTFQDMIRQDLFLEHARVHGEWYGTSRQYVREEMDRGRDVLLEIDVQGARQLKQGRINPVFIFLVPPSMDELARRLTGRSTETSREIKQRMKAARSELASMECFEYVVVNDDVSRAVRDVESILRAEKCRLQRKQARPRDQQP